MPNLTPTENSQPVGEQHPKTVKEDRIGSAQVPSESTSYIQSWRVTESAIEAPLEAHPEKVSIFDGLHSMPDEGSLDADDFKTMLILKELQNPAGGTALICAVKWGGLEQLQDLLLVSDPNLQDEDGWTALMWAAHKGRLECLQALLPVSDPHQKDHEGNTALMRAAIRGHLDCLQALLPVSDANLQDSDGWTALMFAARHGEVECLRALLPLSDPGLRDKEGKSALDLASNDECCQAIRHRIAALEAKKEAEHLERATPSPNTAIAGCTRLGRAL